MGAEEVFNMMIISIHTPARGVTNLPMHRAVKFNDFNPHSRKGSDKIGKAWRTLIRYFNPHSRKGSDP